MPKSSFTTICAPLASTPTVLMRRMKVHTFNIDRGIAKRWFKEHQYSWWGAGRFDHVLSQELHRLNKELKALVDGDQFNPLASGVGFVTFHDSATANQAVQLLLSTNSSCYVTRRAPEPRDICWENMAKPRSISTFFSFRSVIIWALTLTLLFLWAVSEHNSFFNSKFNT